MFRLATAWARTAALSGLLLVLAGCASFDGAPPRPEQGAALDKVDAAYHAALKEYYDKAANPAEQALVRNRFIEMRTGLIDHHYASFRSSLYAQRVGSAVGVDLATLGLNIAGVLTPGEHAKTAMNALSGGLIGGKASIDKNVYFDRTLPALLSQMEAQRNTVRLRLLTGMAEPTARYPLLQAAADLAEYYAAGTLAGAVAGITQQAAAVEASSAASLAARLPSQQEMLDKLRKQGAVVSVAKDDDDFGARLRACLRPQGAAVAANETAVREWLVRKAEPGVAANDPLVVDKLMAGSEAVFARLRKEILADAAFTDKVAACRK